MHKINSLYPEYGTIITPNSKMNINDLSVNEINELFLTKGIVLFKDFNCSPDEFEEFAAKMPYNNFHGHPGGGDFREYVRPHGQTTKASKGNERIYMHPELGYTPYLPDAVWFLCVLPPESGGATLVCDGAEFLKKVPEYILRPLAEKGLLYLSHFPNGYWQGTFAGQDINSLIAKLSKTKGVSSIVFDDKTKALTYKYNVLAVSADRHGTPVFANSLLLMVQPDIVRFFENVIRYGDGTKIPQDHLITLDEIAQSISKPIVWGKGDVVLIDNSRFLHGRTAYTGDRVLHVKYGSAV